MRLLRLRKTIVEINAVEAPFAKQRCNDMIGGNRLSDTNEFFITKKAIESLTEKLGLPDLDQYSQDWEYEIANSSRVNEFVSFYESADLNQSEKFALMSLIISSFDDAVTEGKIQDGIWEKIKGHLISDIDLHRKTILYWSLVEEEVDDCFSSTPFIREIILD
ncbi:hypothetical protein [Paenibacillus alginolyticus]|uniref:Uncharacterized protein n=1 Tax=Paenibacillus alginolyticus TaxID=59839 RepID=A0ABT4GP77_9BACL|nr:hypothetical protein [Paenibacillus alginolyticus]MCY9698017.1 hypothetical protein [Paenibacillus alginolyticus]MEC0148078.1 hypothetical protein [Paenibacillus alginolyticus]